jgi:membrane-associated phospholipid phosphatase
MRNPALALALLLPVVWAGPAGAQGPTVSAALHGAIPARHDVSTLEGLGVTAGIATLFFIDRPARDFLQRHRSKALDGLARVFRRMGSVPVYVGAAVGITGTGLVTGNDAVKRAGGRLLFSEAMTVVAAEIIKKVAGRARPDVSASPWDFDPLKNKQVSFASGHAAMAFVLATSLADDMHNTWASVGLYTFAAGTAWSRLNDNRHWPSDVVGGAVLGFTVSKMMSNRWEILGFNPPRFVQERPDPAP